MVSNKGRVRRDEKILKERLNPAGYSYANLSYEGKSEQPAVHEMVLEAFKVPKPKGVKNPIVKHKNNKKDDNNLDNLEWGDIASNTQDAYSDGLVEGKGANNPKWRKDKAGNQDKQKPIDPPEDSEDGDTEPEDSYEEPEVPEGWRAKQPSSQGGGFDEEGNEERPVSHLPEGWQVKR